MTTSCTTPSRGESGRATWDSTRTGASPGKLCLFRGGRLRHRRAPLRRHGALPRHAQHPVGRLRRQNLHQLRAGRLPARTAQRIHPPGQADRRTFHRRAILRPDHALHAVIQRHLIIYIMLPGSLLNPGSVLRNGRCNSCCGRFRPTVSGHGKALQTRPRI